MCITAGSLHNETLDWTGALQNSVLKQSTVGCMNLYYLIAYLYSSEKMEKIGRVMNSAIY